MLYARAALAVVLGAQAGGAFMIAPTRHAPSSAPLALRVAAPPHCSLTLEETGAEEALPCAKPDESGIMMNDEYVTAQTLRGMELADASGARVRSGSLIGEGKAVIVFLRHLG